MKPLLIALFVTAGLSTAAYADAPAEERFGELHITLKNAEYCRVSVNGDEWTATEFEKGGKLLLIKSLRLDETPNFTVVLSPFNPKLAPATVEVEEKAFKKVRKGRVYYLIAKDAVKFADAKPEGEKPATTPDETPPPPDEDKTGPPPTTPDL